MLDDLYRSYFCWKNEYIWKKTDTRFLPLNQTGIKYFLKCPLSRMRWKYKRAMLWIIRHLSCILITIMNYQIQCAADHKYVFLSHLTTRELMKTFGQEGNNLHLKSIVVFLIASNRFVNRTSRIQTCYREINESKQNNWKIIFRIIL